jgi:hypothetical protein
VHATIADTGSGPDTHTLLGAGFVGQIDTQAAPGTQDSLTLDSSTGKVGFATQAAHKPLTLTLGESVGGERRTAQIATTSFNGPGDALSFTGSHTGLTFTHHGAATTFILTLSAAGPHGAPAVFQSGPLRISARATASIGSIRWSALTGSRVRVRIGRRTLTVRSHLHTKALASIKSLHAKKGHGGTVSLGITAKVDRLPAGAELAFTWVVRSGRHIVATHAELGRTLNYNECFKGTHLQGICARPTYPQSTLYTYAFKPPHKGSYTLTGTVTVVTINGITQSASNASRTLRFKM